MIVVELDFFEAALKSTLLTLLTSVVTQQVAIALNLTAPYDQAIAQINGFSLRVRSAGCGGPRGGGGS